MLRKFVPLHRAPPGCCISKAVLFKLLGCQVAPKLTRARNAHCCCTALWLLLCCVPQSTGTALLQLQSLLPSPNLHSVDLFSLSYNRGRTESDPLRNDVVMIICPHSWWMPLGSPQLRLCSRLTLRGFHICLQLVQDTTWYLGANLLSGLMSSQGLRYP